MRSLGKVDLSSTTRNGKECGAIGSKRKILALFQLKFSVRAYRLDQRECSRDDRRWSCLGKSCESYNNGGRPSELHFGQEISSCENWVNLEKAQFCGQGHSGFIGFDQLGHRNTQQKVRSKKQAGTPHSEG